MYKFFKSLLMITIIVSILFLIGLVWSFVYIGPFRESLTSILKLGLIIPFLLLICFLGMNHHKDSDRFKLKPSFYYTFLLVAVLGATITYLKLTRNDFAGDYSASNSQEKDRNNLNSLPKPISAKDASEVVASNPSHQEVSSATEKSKETQSVVPVKTVANTNDPAPTTETGKGKQPSTETAYKAESKAYVYGEPDEATKKELFIEKQQQSIPLKPRDEKNGFVYVIIPSKGGTVTTGWLRKKDLKKVKVVLDYGKG